MSPISGSALKATVLVGSLVLTASGAHGVTQAQAVCTHSRNLVVVDLDDGSIATSSTTRSTLDVRATRASFTFAATRQRRTAAHRCGASRPKRALTATNTRRPCPMRAGRALTSATC
jgi:hypothetical protein